MSNKNPKPSLHERVNLYQHLIHALHGLVSSTTRLIIAIILLILIFVGLYRSCENNGETKSLLPEETAIRELYSYLACVDEGLVMLESSSDDEQLKLAISNFKQYKQVAIDLPAFKMYPSPTETLNKREKEKLRSYLSTIKVDLVSNAKNFAIQLPDCK